MTDISAAFEKMRTQESQECNAILLAINDPAVKETMQRLYDEVVTRMAALGATVSSNEPAFSVISHAYPQFWENDVEVNLRIKVGDWAGDYGSILDDDKAEFSYDVSHLRVNVYREDVTAFDRVRVTVSCFGTVSAEIPKDDEALLFYTDHLQLKCYPSTPYRALVCNRGDS